MIKPRILIFSGYGLNCEDETKYAFEKAGALVDIIHINDIIDRPSLLKNYQIGAMPGGFSYGDDTGSGNAFAQKIKNHLAKEMQAFFSRDTLTIGMCNGFQILVGMGVFGPVALLPNSNARYTTRWVDLKIDSNSPWLVDISSISLPIAHGEGRFYAPKNQPRRLPKGYQVALTYVKGEICTLQNLSANPNGSMENIAGIVNTSGKILGLMPHPERAVQFTQLPQWPNLKEHYLRKGKKLPTEAPGLQIFKNAVEYFS